SGSPCPAGTDRIVSSLGESPPPTVTEIGPRRSPPRHVRLRLRSYSTRMQQRMCRVAGLGRGPPMLARLSRESRPSHIETRTPNERRKEPSMKKVLIGLMCALLASTASAASAAVVDWNIVGVITAQNVDNPVVRIVNNVPVGTVIHSGTFAWNTRSGHAHV